MLNGLIYDGGLSLRMGMDKGSIIYHDTPQRDYLHKILKRHVSDVYLSCHPDRLPETVIPVLKDVFFNAGPLGGLLTAFDLDPVCSWLTVPCDTPMLDHDIIVQLINERDPDKIASCFFDLSGAHPEPLVAIWEPKAKSILLKEYHQGQQSIFRVLHSNDVKMIFPHDPQKLMNVNTEEERDRYFGER